MKNFFNLIMLFDTLTSCRTWKNVGHFYDKIASDNFTLNVFLKYEVKKFVNFITNQYDYLKDQTIKSCSLYSVFIKLLSRFLNCNVFISNFNYEKKYLKEGFSPTKILANVS